MESLYNFVVEPLGERYNNVKKIGDKELIINTEIYNHEHVNRLAVVLSTPKLTSTEINAGDVVLVHHNVFRRWHDVKGVERNSKAFFQENKYIISEDQIFLRKSSDKWKPIKGFCFVKPLKAISDFNTELEKHLVGIVKYSDGSFDVGSLVGFTPNSKYEFIVDGQRLYRVYSKFITIQYEYQGNEEEYNPSWA